MYQFKGKTAIVTGSTRGIGKAIALRLGEEGANLVLSYRKRDEDAEKTLEEFKKKNIKAIAVKGDLSRMEECQNVIDRAEGEFGKIDILINNAGVGFFRFFKDIDEKLVNKTIDADLKSVIYCSLFASRKMQEGVIINMSSITGILPGEGLPIYSAVKAGIIALTKSMAIELSPKIRVNAIAPGLVVTELGGSLMDVTGTDINEWAKRYTLTGQATYPDDIAEAAMALIRMANITGQVITIDGGQSLIAGKVNFGT